jgi:hypothetical protein
MRAGKLFLFNTATQELRVTLNDQPLPKAIDAANSRTNPYRLGTTTVERAAELEPHGPVFGHRNRITCTYAGFSSEYMISAPPSRAPMEANLELYVFYAGAVLVKDGEVLFSQFEPGSQLDRILQQVGDRPVGH